MRGTVTAALWVLAAWGGVNAGEAFPAPPIVIGERLEPFVDRALIEKMDGVTHALCRPVDAGIALRFEAPHEGKFCGYCTVIHDQGVYRLYYRGMPGAGADGSAGEVTCYAESKDGKEFTKPKLGLFEVGGTRANNVVLAQAPPFSHNFSPLLDARPGVAADERYKALAGTRATGLVAWGSADGIRWRKLREEPVLTKGAFDSQNLAFWSPSENRYVAYFRTFKKIGTQGYRWIARATSSDFFDWSEPVEMTFGSAPPEHLYTNQTHPYFRAPHIYIALAARFMPGRQVLSEEEARQIEVDPGYFRDCSDGVLLTSRGGNRYERTFLEGFVRPGIGPRNWVSRTCYPALNVVPTGPEEMSFYVNQDYGQPTAHLRRYTLRPDGFASLRADYGGGEWTSRELVFAGARLELNFATSAAGEIKVEIQDAGGAPMDGFSLGESVPVIGNELARPVRWRRGSDVSSLAGRPVRLRFVMKDADLFAMRFAPADGGSEGNR